MKYIKIIVQIEKNLFLFSVNDIKFDSKKKNNLKKLAEDTLIRYIKNGDDNSEYGININLNDKYLDNDLYAKPIDLHILSKYSLLKYKNDPLVKSLQVDNKILKANIGKDQIVQSGNIVTISSDLSTGDIVSYKWKRIGGTGDSNIISTSVVDEAKLSFTSDILTEGSDSATHIFELTLNGEDETTISSKDTITITILAPELPNRKPIANAGLDQVVTSEQEVSLNGFKSRDPDGDILRYSWVRTSGTGNANISLSNIRSINPTFIADRLGVHDLPVTHIFELTVTDPKGLDNTDKVTITILPEENQPPVADAGLDVVVESGSTYRLNGTATTDPNANIVSFLWTRVGGNGDPLIQIKNQDTARPTITFETTLYVIRTHTFRLTVIDSLGLFSTDTVTISVNVPHNPPVVDAGSTQVVIQGEEVQLSGIVTPGSSEVVRYSWIVGNNIDNPILVQDRAIKNPRFIAPTLPSGENRLWLPFTFHAYDSNNRSGFDNLAIYVLRENTLPVSNAGEDRIVSPLKTVILNGLASSDPNDQPITYHWEQRTSGTGSRVTIESPREAVTSFVTEDLVAGSDPITYVFSLTVTDSSGASHVDTVTITVDPDKFRTYC